MKVQKSRPANFITGFLFLSQMVFSQFSCGPGGLASEENQASNGVEKKQKDPTTAADFISEEVTSSIALTLETRCRNLLAEKISDTSCKFGMQVLAKELDFKLAIGSSKQTAFTFFGTALEELLSDQASVNFMEKLQERIYALLYDGSQFNLWDFTFSESGQNEALALKRLAVLLQDGSENATQVKYLLIKKHPMAFKIEELLRTIALAQSTQKFSAYPSQIDSSRHTLYHYYVPRWLGRRLKDAKLPSDVSVVLPFLFNSSYELRQIHSPVTENQKQEDLTWQTKWYADGNQKLEQLIVRWNIFDYQYRDLIDHLTGPFAPFNGEANRENLEDIYLGYLGSCHSNLTLHKPLEVKCLGRDEFSVKFSQNPALFIKNMIR